MFRDADMGKSVARGTGGCVKAWAQAVDDHDGHQLGYFAPLLPAMETPQIVRAHDPDESDSGAAGPQPGYRIVRVSRLNDSFETGDINARMMCESARGRDPLEQRGKTAGVLEGVAGCHQPPDAVKPQSLECEQSRCEMGLMRRVKGSAKQADPHARRMRGQ